MFVTLMIALTASADAAPGNAWSCRNQVEVWCDSETCLTKPPEETTPLSVRVDADGRFSACAYSGCWEGTGRLRRVAERLLLTAEGIRFTSGSGAMDSDVTVLIVESDGVGFLRAGGLATPLMCSPARSP